MNLQKAAKEYAEPTDKNDINEESIERYHLEDAFEAGGNYVLGELNAQLIAKEQRIAELEKKLEIVSEALIGKIMDGDHSEMHPISARAAAESEVNELLKSPETKQEDLKTKYAEAVKVIEFYSRFEHIRSFESDQMAILEVDEAHPENNKAFKFLKEHL